jgi:hypothetical protein
MGEDLANAKGRGAKPEKILSWPSRFRHGICAEGLNKEDTMRDKTSEIRKLEAEATRILKRRQRHDARGRQLAEAEKGHQETIEAVILSTIRTAGLTKLPLSELLENIMALGQAASTSNVGEGAPKSNGDFRVPHPQSGGSKSEANVDRGGCEVFVKLSSNTSAAHREVLEKSGLRWNGRRGGWIGNVDEATTEILRERFSDRLSIPSTPLGSSESELDEEPTEAEPTTPPANPASAEVAVGSSSLAEAVDAIGLLARRDTGSEDTAASAVGDNARLPSSSLPPRPGALPKIPFTRRPQTDGQPAD